MYKPRIIIIPPCSFNEIEDKLSEYFDWGYDTNPNWEIIGKWDEHCEARSIISIEKIFQKPCQWNDSDLAWIKIQFIYHV